MVVEKRQKNIFTVINVNLPMISSILLQIATTFDEMDGNALQKCIDHLKAKIEEK